MKLRAIALMTCLLALGVAGAAFAQENAAPLKDGEEEVCTTCIAHKKAQEAAAAAEAKAESEAPKVNSNAGVNK